MGKYNSLLALFCAGLALLTSACLDTVSTESNENKNELTGEYSGSREFQYNYIRLYFLYINSTEELDNPSAYIGKGDEIFSQYEIPWDYWDVYYLYDQMSDKYTRYVDPMRSVEYMNSMTYSETVTGTGFIIDTLVKDKFIIESIAQNSPADKGGLKVGDTIVEIDKAVPSNQKILRKLTRGEIGDTLLYTVKRDTSVLDLKVVLDVYYSPTAKLYFKDSIPVIKISEFTPYTSNESGTLGEVTEMLKATEKYKSVIIDLRNNGGGDGDQCMGIANQFLSKGDTTIGIISTKADTLNNKQDYDTTFNINGEEGIASKRYLVTLANEYSASCSEIFIASLTSNRQMPIVGTTTFGKGIGQTSSYTPAYAISTITAMRVIDKDRNSYHKYGFAPDFEISDDEAALEKAVALAKERKFKRTAGYGTSNRNFLAKRVDDDDVPGFHMMKK